MGNIRYQLMEFHSILFIYIKGGTNMSNKVYDTLKWIAQILLPALATLYFALAAIWGLPAAEQVVGTITAIDTFLGVLLGISTSNYKKRQEVEQNDSTGISE